MAFNVNGVHHLHYSSRCSYNQCQSAQKLFSGLMVNQHLAKIVYVFFFHVICHPFVYTCIYKHRKPVQYIENAIWLCCVLKKLLDTSHPPSSSVTLTRPRNGDGMKTCSHSTKPFCPPAKPEPSRSAPKCRHQSSCRELLNAQTYPTLSCMSLKG